MAKTLAMSPLVASLLVLPLARPAAAQTNASPVVQEAGRLVDDLIADPGKRDALCAYRAAQEGVGAAQANPGAATALNPGLRALQQQQMQMDAMRHLGAAQGGLRAAADAVDPRFYNAMQAIGLGDMNHYLAASVRIEQLCAPQQ